MYLNPTELYTPRLSVSKESRAFCENDEGSQEFVYDGMKFTK